MNDSRPPAADGDLYRRLHRALTVDKEELFALVSDASAEVLLALLKNPALDDNHLVALLRRRDLAEEVLRRVASLDRFETSRAVRLAFARSTGAPTQLVLPLLPQLYLFELLELALLPCVGADLRLAAERAILQRLPLTPLGNKLALARRGTAAVVEALLAEGDARVVEACLGNPHLKEGAIFRFLSGAAAGPESISVVLRHQRWKQRPGLRGAALRNRRTPLVWFHHFLPALPPAEVKNLAASPRLSPQQRGVVAEELSRRGLK